MIADSICIRLYSNIQERHVTGVVHSVFKNAFNVMTSDNDFITILNCNKPMGRNSVRVSNNISFLNFNINQGMKVSFYDKCINLENGLNIHISNASTWDGRPIYTYSTDTISNIFSKLEIMKNFIINTGEEDGILPLLSVLNEKYPELKLVDINIDLDKTIVFIKDRFRDFIEAYILENKELIADKVKNIIGYGAGLTPSMDDFISGLMISRIYLFYYLNKDIKECLDFNNLMIREIDHRTTRVSEEMLKYSSIGEVNQDIRDLMVSLVSEEKNSSFFLNLKKVACIGETSGIDIISGIYIGSRIFLGKQ